MSSLVESIFSLLVFIISVSCVLPFLGMIDLVEVRMDEAVTMTAVDRSQTLSRYSPKIRKLQKAMKPEGLWIDQRYVIPMRDLSFLTDEKRLSFRDGFCTLGGTLEIGDGTLVVLPVTGLVRKGD